MKYYVLQSTNWEKGITHHVGVFPESEIDEALMISFQNMPPFTAFHKEEVKFYDKAQKLREAINAGSTKETPISESLPIR
jgi:hypothetical protein